MPTDTGDVAQCRALVERAVEQFGRLDVVVSSAAKGAPNHTIMHADLDDWEQAWLVNVLGPLELFRTAVPHLAAAGDGAIVAVSALAVRGDQPGTGCVRGHQGPRSRSRRRRWRARWASTASASNVVVPGFVPGPNTEDDVHADGGAAGTTVEAVQEQIAADTALRRLPTPDDIADAIVFLASERARSITGQTLDVNGGRWFSSRTVLASDRVPPATAAVTSTARTRCTSRRIEVPPPLALN